MHNIIFCRSRLLILNFFKCAQHACIGPTMLCCTVFLLLYISYIICIIYLYTSIHRVWDCSAQHACIGPIMLCCTVHRILTCLYIIYNLYCIFIYKHSPNLRLQCSACLYWALNAVLDKWISSLVNGQESAYTCVILSFIIPNFKPQWECNLKSQCNFKSQCEDWSHKLGPPLETN